jgi:hypothetical protein
MNRIGIQSGLEGIRGGLFDIGMLKPKTQEVLLAAIDALRGPQPDPDTGLVPCGCGGKPKKYTTMEHRVPHHQPRTGAARGYAVSAGTDTAPIDGRVFCGKRVRA